MWQGYGYILAVYGLAMCTEWVERGYKDNLRDVFASLLDSTPEWGIPPWLGNEAFHESHQKVLMVKNPEHYGRFGWPYWGVAHYLWPTWNGTEWVMVPGKTIYDKTLP